jgi:dolichol-phosphate mannosyltransferase
VPLLSIIVPVFNEHATVGTVIDRLQQIALPVEREIVVVDDGSTDGTGDVLRDFTATPALRIVHAPRNAGKGAAVRLGLAHAAGDIIAIQDADLELDPAQLAALVEPILQGRAQVVYGSRFLNGRPAAPFATLAGNRVLTAVTNALFGANLTDMETCYKIMAGDVARSLDLRANSFDLEPEITGKLLRRGIPIVELPVRFEPRSRAEGKKIRWRHGWTALGVLVRERARR